MHSPPALLSVSQRVPNGTIGTGIGVWLLPTRNLGRYIAPPRITSLAGLIHLVLLVSISMNTISWSPSLMTSCSAPESL